ncbi:MAG: NAD(P)/FAD-dependent oxidoreductase [Paracoccaceae bacterium]
MAFDSGKGRVLVIGAGPAGLTTAYELQKRSADHVPIIIESGDLVGGIARTESFKGFRFDIGGHRFFTKVGEVEQMWHEVMGDDFIIVPRKSRIYYRNRYYDYPLKIFNALSNIGVYESGRILLSYAKWRIKPSPVEESFEQWVINRFGGRLYMHFFRSYTEKVWGIPPSEIQADWAAQRIKNLSLWKAVVNAITGANSTTSLIEQFHYPRLGPGMMWEKVRELVRGKGGEVRMRSRVDRIHWKNDRVDEVGVIETSDDGTERRYAEKADHVVSTMALTDLVAAFDPPPPLPVLEAAARLRYRDFLIVTLILDHPDPFPDNWIYIHSPKVKVGRIQNFRAWSQEMVPNPGQASIGMEYFCHEGDGLWNMSDAELIKLGAAELAELGLAPSKSVIDGSVIRQVKAYPVYDSAYREALDVIAGWLGSLKNFQTVGRNGLHRYNNQDHSMLTAMLAARNILGESHDVWTINVERSYHEELEIKRDGTQAA